MVRAWPWSDVRECYPAAPHAASDDICLHAHLHAFVALEHAAGFVTSVGMCSVAEERDPELLAALWDRIL